jgi:HEAT repeat protein
MGDAVADALAKLLRDSDAEVRELAVHCLDEAGGPRVGSPLVSALLDEDAQVAMAAARALHRHVFPALQGRLLGAYDAQPEGAVRREIALVFGRTAGKSAAPSELVERLRKEPDAEAREGLLWALARFGNPEAREEFVARLQGAQGAERKRYLDGVAYLGQPWVLKALLPLLDDGTPVLRVGVDARPDLIDSLRACDLAVVLIAEIAQAGFSFPVNRAKNYSEAELAEVRTYLRGLP